ncbi:MAG: response regulator [bacterium]
MKLICPLCTKEYIFDTDRIPDQGFRIQCSGCQTKISVNLPEGWKNYKLMEKTAAQAKPVTEPSADDKFILLADDTEFFRALMSDLLINHGFKVKTAADGQEALEIYEASPESFQLILLDLQMPRLSGFGVLEHLSKSGESFPPVIVMTGVHDSHDDIQIVKNMGAAAFLDKSLDPSVAFERIQMVLNPDAAQQ